MRERVNGFGGVCSRVLRIREGGHVSVNVSVVVGIQCGGLRAD